MPEFSNLETSGVEPAAASRTLNPNVAENLAPNLAPNLAEDVQRARRHVDALRVALQSTSPEDLARCIPELEEAVACLQGIEHSLRGPSAKVQPAIEPPAGPAKAGRANQEWEPKLPMAQQLHSLNRELEIAQRLVIHGTAFCDGWARMLGSAAGGYGASGDPAPLSAPGTVLING